MPTNEPAQNLRREFGVGVELGAEIHAASLATN
jgi:hypothetical protein